VPDALPGAQLGHRLLVLSGWLHGDESGWRVDGKTHWLWCFTTPELTSYLIDRSRGGPVLAKFFLAEFAGTLVTATTC